MVMVRSIMLLAIALASTGGVPSAARASVPHVANAPAPLSPAARAAATTVDAFHAALHRGDTRAAAALLADDALIFESGGAERSKAEYAAHHLGADAEFSKAVTSSVTRRAGASDGTLAWIATEGRTSGSFKGRLLDESTTETMVLRRIGRTWKIVHIHWSSGGR
jgi:ketosteroid isomerase-like protein